MNSRAALKYVVLFMGALGILLASLPFLGSFSPSDAARANRPHFSLAELRPGTFIERDGERSKVFVLRDHSGEVFVYTVPFLKGKYWLPDVRWERPNLSCNSFGPESKDGFLEEGGVFHCRDSAYGEYYEGELRWTLNGKSLGVRTEDMRVPKHEVINDTLYLEGW